MAVIDIILFSVTCLRSLCTNHPNVTRRDAEHLHLLVSVGQLHNDCSNTTFRSFRNFWADRNTGITKILLPSMICVTSVRFDGNVNNNAATQKA